MRTVKVEVSGLVPAAIGVVWSWVSFFGDTRAYLLPEDPASAVMPNEVGQTTMFSLFWRLWSKACWETPETTLKVAVMYVLQQAVRWTYLGHESSSVVTFWYHCKTLQYVMFSCGGCGLEVQIGRNPSMHVKRKRVVYIESGRLHEELVLLDHASHFM